MCMRKSSRNRWKRMETVGFSDCFEIGLDGGEGISVIYSRSTPIWLKKLVGEKWKIEKK